MWLVSETNESLDLLTIDGFDSQFILKHNSNKTLSFK